MKSEWAEEVQNKHREMQRACVGCFYQRATFGNGTDRNLANFSCDYILITGKKRPCKPGKDCTVRLEKQLEDRIIREDIRKYVEGEA